MENMLTAKDLQSQIKYDFRGDNKTIFDEPIADGTALRVCETQCPAVLGRPPATPLILQPSLFSVDGVLVGLSCGLF